MLPKHQILCQDSVTWLERQPNQSIPNFMTGMPDLNDMAGPKIDIDEYKQWFSKVASLIFQKVSPDGYCIFIQTDRKKDGQLIDKSYLLTHMAYQHSLKLLWHKIICLRDVGKTNLFRPTYSHFLCYSLHGKPGTAFPDVFPVSKQIYANATPIDVAKIGANFIAKHSHASKYHLFPYQVVDPFCGMGTLGLASLQSGLTFLGIDIDQKQCDKTSNMILEN